MVGCQSYHRCHLCAYAYWQCAISDGVVDIRKFARLPRMKAPMHLPEVREYFGNSRRCLLFWDAACGDDGACAEYCRFAAHLRRLWRRTCRKQKQSRQQ